MQETQKTSLQDGGDPPCSRPDIIFPIVMKKTPTSSNPSVDRVDASCTHWNYFIPVSEASFALVGTIYLAF